MGLFRKSVGIVGSEAAKFTPETEQQARALIRELLQGATEAVSGHCHLGGIDIWVEEEAAKMGIPCLAFAPTVRNWTGGYKPRNIKIAKWSDEVHCITLRKLPPGYMGMEFDGCYHCHTHDHVKSGGCWTMHYARRLKKPGILHILT